MVLEPTFDGWRRAARPLLASRVPADRIVWSPAGDPQTDLFGGRSGPIGGVAPKLPRRFFDLARRAVCFDGPDRFAVPYRVALRLADDRGLLDDPVDEDVALLRRRARAVDRDVHDMHAYVRFRPVTHAPTGDRRWVAYHEPVHWIVAEAAPHFAARFGDMRFVILTPRGSVEHEPGNALAYGPAISAPPRDPEDPLEELWRTYYASVHDPARPPRDVLPRRHWATLPETREIPRLLRDAPARVRANAEAVRGGVAPWLPEPGADHATFVARLRACAGCELAGPAGAAVPGEGPLDARIVLVGEQPGDNEDRLGRPFVGPAGGVLDGALAAAGLDRRALYLTNAVKHFRHRREGWGQRIHEKPDRYHVEVCRPWVLWELETIRPVVAVALGATAAHALLGRAVGVSATRGQILRGPFVESLLVAPHPSAVLRAGARGPAIRAHLVEALRHAAVLAARREGPGAPDVG